MEVEANEWGGKCLPIAKTIYFLIDCWVEFVIKFGICFVYDFFAIQHQLLKEIFLPQLAFSGFPTHNRDMCNYTMYQIVSVDLLGIVQISVGHNIDAETLIFRSFLSFARRFQRCNSFCLAVPETSTANWRRQRTLIICERMKNN